MAKVIPELDDALIEWVGDQPVFFVASAPTEGGHVNLSPKGHDTVRVLSPTSVAYLDLTGSGAETIAHTRQNGRLTLMWCAFSGPPRILRMFGTGTAHAPGSPRFGDLVGAFPELPGIRSIVELSADRIQTSCGYSVPFLDLVGERPTLRQWADRKSPEELDAYRAEKNARSIDGLPALDGW